MKAKQDHLPINQTEKYLNLNPSSSVSSLVPRGVTEDDLTAQLTRKFKSVSDSIERETAVLVNKLTLSLFPHLQTFESYLYC